MEKKKQNKLKNRLFFVFKSCYQLKIIDSCTLLESLIFGVMLFSINLLSKLIVVKFYCYVNDYSLNTTRLIKSLVVLKVCFHLPISLYAFSVFKREFYEYLFSFQVASFYNPFVLFFVLSGHQMDKLMLFFNCILMIYYLGSFSAFSEGLFNSMLFCVLLV